MTYEYKVVPFIGRNRGRLSAEDVASQLETLISQQVAEGWEFYQLSDVNIEIRPGCIAGLFGASAQYARFDQLIFRTNEEARLRASERTRDAFDDRVGQSPHQQPAEEPKPSSKSLYDDRPDRLPFTISSKLTATWRQKSDAQVREALGSIREFTEESQQVILAEYKLRSLEPATASERAALESLLDNRYPESDTDKNGAVSEDETDSLAYCYHCGSDVAPGTRRCATCGKNL